ncbi:MAG: hypothetical protein ACPGKG_09025 [Paracoccaceae bacterium]
MSISPTILNKDYNSSTLFTERFQAESILINSPNAINMGLLLKNHLINLLSLPNDINIPDMENFLTEEQKVYDPIFGVNKITELLYDTPKEITECYFKLLKEDIRPSVGIDFYYQVQPTIRLQTPHETAKKFYPLFHSDIQFGHPPYEFNVWLPLSEPSPIEGHGFVLSAFEESHSLFDNYGYDILKMNKDSKSLSGKLYESAIAQNMPLGEVLLFDSRKFHSTMPLNQHLRASLDVRIIPKIALETVDYFYTGLGRKKARFEPGQAYSSNSIDES